MNHNESLLDGFVSAGAITFPWWFNYVSVSAELYILVGGVALITLRVIKATHDYIKVALITLRVIKATHDYIKGRDKRRAARLG